jgi:acyl carrier protein
MTEQIKQILEEVRGVPGLSQQLADSASIIDDVGLDSLEMLTFMLTLEQRLGVRIDFEEMSFTHLQSISALSEFLSGSARVAEA